MSNYGNPSRIDQTAVNSNITVGKTTPTLASVSSVNLEGRDFLTVQPINGIVYYGYDNTVTISTGTRIKIGTQQIFSHSDDITVYLISNRDNVDVRITEGK